MIGEVIVAATVVVPLLTAAVAVFTRSPGRSGRIVTASTAAAAVLAALALGLAAADPGGRVGGSLVGVDRALAIVLLVVLGTATVVASFGTRSIDHDRRTTGFFAAIAVLVAGSTLVVVATAPILLVAGWIVSGWALAALVGFDRSGRRVRAARRRIVRSLAVGDAALVLALVLAARSSDGVLADGAGAAARLGESDLVGIPVVDLVAVLLVVAGLSRSAVLPFHRWLVGTIAAPTPVSAIVHAGFVSGAGILLVRFTGLFVVSEPAVLLAFGAATLTVLLASSVSVNRPDVKGSLAWSTVAQMAFMVIQCAVGAFSSAIVHIAGHGMYKAARFLGAGDTISAAVGARRRPVGAAPVSPSIRRVAVVIVPTLAVGVGFWWFPPLVNDAGRVLIAVFAWVTVAAALSGWISRRPLGPVGTVVTGSVVAIGAGLAYLGGLRAVETFVKPTLGSPETVVGPEVLVGTFAVVGVVVGLGRLRGPVGVRLARAGARARIRWCDDAIPLPRPSRDVAPIQKLDVGDAERSRIRSDAALAAAVVAPMWPLSSFVAVNPLGGLEAMGFDRAGVAARRWLRGRTHLPLAEFRSDHERGLTRLADLEYVVHQRLAELCARPPQEVAGRLVAPVDIVVADLLHGPESDDAHPPRTALERAGLDGTADMIDDLVCGWAARYMAEGAPPASFVAMSLDLVGDDPRLGAVLTPSTRAWLSDLAADPASVIAAAFLLSGVDADARVDEMRGHLARVAGWAGLAKWKNEWAPPSDHRPPFAPIELLAVRAVLEAIVVRAVAGTVGDEPVTGPARAGGTAVLDARVRAVAAMLAPGGKQRDLDAIRTILAAVPEQDRAAIWLEAQERCFDDRLLTVLDRVDPGRRVDRLEAQLVFCIDVRSEGLRRHLEELGDVETLGFAGFFGVPLSVRRFGWEHEEPRCPVLVAPSIRAVEHPVHGAVQTVAAGLGAERRRAGLLAAHDTAKKAPGAAFVLAEALGWLTGPVAATRTLMPGRATRPEARATRMLLDESVLLEQRVFAAESVLRTMGLVDRFAPLVLLCGHTSHTVNNAHASALDCGACGGAAGDDNALAVAALLNSPDVRLGLGSRGIEIPDDTWFVAGVHDTASDHVTILDGSLAPPSHADRVARLQDLLDRAGAAQASARARHLRGAGSRVRDRGVDWAQVRPEWGLARAAAFVIGPRSLTAGTDLDGRAFLHGYAAEHDPTGRVLETIMTAPLIVAHWITSQYYFSTVDPEVFGAGDKLLHNPIGTIGVVSGDGGDLRVGLPLQSTHVDGRRHHQPIRLLAVIQADLSRIEQIIGRHQILQTLVAGSWLRIAARSHPHELWSTRTAAGTWITNPRRFEAESSIAQDTPIAHTEMT